MANYWLVKSEPDTYSFDDLVRDGKTVWDGVKAPAAALNLKAMAVGDPVLFYHSGDGKAVVGLAKVAKTAFPDPGDATGRWVAVEIAADRPVPKPVPLSALKANSKLATLPIVREPRLSVQAVTPEGWAEILKMAGG